MPGSMELRRSIKAPRRYEDELEHGRQPLKPNAYVVKVIQYNPYLPPAAFPTLDSRQPACEKYHVDNHAPQRNYKIDRNPSDPPSENYHIDSDASLDQSTDTAFYLTDSQLLRFPATSPMARSYLDNGPGNPTWESNMSRMAASGPGPEEDRFSASMGEVIEEMETSDEGDSQPSRPPKRKARGKVPSWDSIAPSLQIEMVYAAAGEDVKAELAMARLKLNPFQQAEMVKKIRDYEAREAAEDAHIAEHQNQLTEKLLHGPPALAKQDLFQDLYKIDRPETVVSRKEVDNARVYMASCALDVSFLDNWGRMGNVPGYIVTASDDEIDAKFPLSVSMRGVQASERKGVPDRGRKTTLAQRSKSTKRQVTGDTIEVDTKVPSISKDQQTPQQIPTQGPDLGPSPVNQPVALRQILPSPFAMTLPLPVSGESDYKPKPKKQRKSATKTKPSLLQGSTSGLELSSVPKTNGTSSKKPLAPINVLGSTAGNGAVSNKVPQGLQETSHDTNDGSSTGAESSSVQTSQEDSTIIVDVPGEPDISAGRNGEMTCATASKPKKRGRPKKFGVPLAG